MILPREYFDRPTLEVARALVGKYLVREQGSGLLAGRIIEVEAYIGSRLAELGERGRNRQRPRRLPRRPDDQGGRADDGRLVQYGRRPQLR